MSHASASGMALILRVTEGSFLRFFFCLGLGLFFGFHRFSASSSSSGSSNDAVAAGALRRRRDRQPAAAAPVALFSGACSPDQARSARTWDTSPASPLSPRRTSSRAGTFLQRMVIASIGNQGSGINELKVNFVLYPSLERTQLKTQPPAAWRYASDACMRTPSRKRRLLLEQPLRQRILRRRFGAAPQAPRPGCSPSLAARHASSRTPGWMRGPITKSGTCVS